MLFKVRFKLILKCGPSESHSMAQKLFFTNPKQGLVIAWNGPKSTVQLIIRLQIRIRMRSILKKN